MNEILTLQQGHDLVLLDSFDFQYAQVAYSAGRTATTIAALNRYLVAVGRERASGWSSQRSVGQRTARSRPTATIA